MKDDHKHDFMARYQQQMFQQQQQQQQHDDEKALVVINTADGATVEVPKRTRGRPPGSKNKPKSSPAAAAVAGREGESAAAAMRPHILEIPAGHDVVDSLARFSRRRNLGICVLAGTGSVANITLRQPASAATVVFHGRFDILTISATFLPPAMSAVSPAVAGGGLSVSLAGPQGQIIGGTVAGPLVAAAAVVVVAAAFSNPTFDRLPADDDVSISVSVSDVNVGVGSGDVENKEYQQQQHHSNLMSNDRRSRGLSSQSTADMIGYSAHLPADVVWASAARPAF